MFSIMKRPFLIIFAACVAFTVCAFAPPANAQKEGKKASTTTVTGCLQKGEKAGEFSITGDDGKIYGLRSSSVKLADHVGHKVTVTGKFKAEEHEKDDDDDEAMENRENGKKEAGEIQITKLKMVSDSCK